MFALDHWHQLPTAAEMRACICILKEAAQREEDEDDYEENESGSKCPKTATALPKTIQRGKL